MRLKYPFVLFDLDGTLTDPFEGITKSVQYALRALGIEEPDRRRLARFIGPPMKESLMEFYGMSEEEALYGVRKYRERFSAEGWRENLLFDGVPQMLSTLRDAGAFLGIASSKPQIFVERILEHFQLSEYFDLVCGSELDGTRSHKAQVIAYALQQIGADAASVVMVGDRMYDLDGAAQNGIDAVGVCFGYAVRGELSVCPHVYLAQDILSLTRFLLRKEDMPLPFSSDVCLHTPRLCLRTPRLQDAPEVFQATGDVRVGKNMRFGTHSSLSQAEVLVKSYLDGKETGTCFPFTIQTLDTGQFVGLFAFRREHASQDTLHLSLFLSQNHWNQGYATELLKVLKPFAFHVLGAHELRAYVLEYNKASQRTLEKCGFLLSETQSLEDSSQKLLVFTAKTG